MTGFAFVEQLLIRWPTINGHGYAEGESNLGGRISISAFNPRGWMR